MLSWSCYWDDVVMIMSSWSGYHEHVIMILLFGWCHHDQVITTTLSWSCYYDHIIMIRLPWTCYHDLVIGMMSSWSGYHGHVIMILLLRCHHNLVIMTVLYWPYYHDLVIGWCHHDLVIMTLLSWPCYHDLVIGMMPSWSRHHDNMLASTIFCCHKFNPLLGGSLERRGGMACGEIPPIELGGGRKQGGWLDIPGPILIANLLHYAVGWVDFWRKFDFEWKYPRNIFIFMKKYRK
jgi:hypothetical protein